MTGCGIGWSFRSLPTQTVFCFYDSAKHICVSQPDHTVSYKSALEKHMKFLSGIIRISWNMEYSSSFYECTGYHHSCPPSQSPKHQFVYWHFWNEVIWQTNQLSACCQLKFLKGPDSISGEATGHLSWQAELSSGQHFFNSASSWANQGESLCQIHDLWKIHKKNPLGRVAYTSGLLWKPPLWKGVDVIMLRKLWQG